MPTNVSLREKLTCQTDGLGRLLVQAGRLPQGVVMRIFAYAWGALPRTAEDAAADVWWGMPEAEYAQLCS